jgi:hypothetical protein
MSLDYIRTAYNVPAKKGGRVRYTGDCTKLGEPKLGTITGTEGARLRIRMDGDSFSNIYHPTWELEYLP